MSQVGHAAWGSDLEALAIAKIYNRSVLIWTLQTRSHGFLMNHKPETAAFGAFHLLHSGQHYDALLCNSDDKNPRSTLDLAARNSNNHRTVIDLGTTRETQNPTTTQLHTSKDRENLAPLGSEAFFKNSKRPNQTPPPTLGKRRLPAYMIEIAAKHRKRVRKKDPSNTQCSSIGKRRCPPCRFEPATKRQALASHSPVHPTTPYKPCDSVLLFGIKAVNTKRRRPAEGQSPKP
jgi:hypothetical protein